MVGPTVRFGSLFSGIGGLDLGLERAGMECAWQVEQDDYCQRVLTRHWPDVPKYGDIRELDVDSLERVDLVAGGFPCQPVSIAGRRKAQEDDRWLWPEFARVLRSLRPRYALLENVPGLLARGFGDVLADLAALGYDAQWDCVPAAAVGAPHLRRRVFVLAYSLELFSDGEDDHAGVGVEPEAVPESRDDRGPTNMADTDNSGRDRWTRVFRSGGGPEPEDGGGWATEPDVGRVAHGVSSRVDRLRALGNAVVPQVAEHVGRLLVAFDKATA